MKNSITNYDAVELSYYNNFSTKLNTESHEWATERLAELETKHLIRVEGEAKMAEMKANGTYPIIEKIVKVPFGKAGKAKYVAHYSNGTSSTLRKGNATYNFMLVYETHECEYGTKFSMNQFKDGRQITIENA